jgi:hypothetical protein
MIRFFVMAGTSPGMTSFTTKPRFYWLHFESDSQDEDYRNENALASPRVVCRHRGFAKLRRLLVHGAG